MRSFPFDSEVTYDELGNPSFDRGVDSSILADFLHLMFGDGVFPNPSTGLQVTTSENDMSVVVLPGNCMIQGRMGIEEHERELVFEASGTSYDRIDSVVARLNTNYDYRDIDLYVVRGTEASVPAAPDLTRTGGIYEIRLANVFIAKNTTVITAERITDTRLTSECGIVTSNPNPVDTNTIFNQYQAALNEYLVYVQECIDGTTVSNLQKQIDEVAENSAENLIPYPYYDISTTSRKGIAVEEDNGVLTLSGATGSEYFWYSIIGTSQSYVLEKGTYTLSGVPNGASWTTYRLALTVQNTGDVYNVYDSVTFTLTENAIVTMSVIVAANVTLNTPITFKPMLVKGSHKCPYNPYSLSKAKLREDVDALNSSLTMFEVYSFPPNYQTINSGHASSCVAYRKGKFVTLKLSFSIAYFDVSQYLCCVPDEIKPSCKVNGLIRCHRITSDYSGNEDFISASHCYIDTNGKLWQTFNSESTATPWTGEVFIEYPIE